MGLRITEEVTEMVIDKLSSEGYDDLLAIAAMTLLNVKHKNPVLVPVLNDGDHNKVISAIVAGARLAEGSIADLNKYAEIVHLYEEG